MGSPPVFAAVSEKKRENRCLGTLQEVGFCAGDHHHNEETVMAKQDPNKMTRRGALAASLGAAGVALAGTAQALAKPKAAVRTSPAGTP